MTLAPPVAGPLRFARFALPPNQQGYCGPDRTAELVGYAASGRVDGGLAELARAFEGAWPYLELLGSVLGVDPLSEAVVDAYWLGAPAGRRVPLGDLGDSLRMRFGGRSGWAGLRDAIPAGGWPTHAFHVLCVYPWVGLMRSGVASPGLEIVDRCRIRPGRVLEVVGEEAVVASTPLELVGGELRRASLERVERASISPGLGLVAPGDAVALHWDWACEVLTAEQRGWLDAAERAHLALANRGGSGRPLDP